LRSSCCEESDALSFEAMSDNIVVHDLRKGIPAEEGSVDAVYHSHTLEHIDRDDVPGFMAEILRVLKPGGIHRIVVPDLEAPVRAYLKDLDAGNDDHDRTIERFLEQAVRR
jgi:predicted SAM-dependent methyltransferase